jgi:hypothetical protein
MSHFVEFKKADDEQQVVLAEVYAPGVPDSQGDFMTAEEIRLMAYGFMKKGQMGNVDREHDNQTFGATIVESFIARDGDPDFIPGSWVVGVYIPDPAQWANVKNGTFNGFSFDGEGDRHDREITLEVPDWLVGETSVTNDHSHVFTVRYGPSGEFLGGETGITDGHSHEIKRGTVTEETDGHDHRFSYVELIDGPTESQS